MDAGIADTINRHAASLIAANLDRVDVALGLLTPWHRAPMAATFMGENDARDADRAWLFGILAARTPELDFDGEPADCDWENMFACFRAEITARRAPETPHSAQGANRRAEVV